MGLPSELISQFVKITNDSKKKPKETTVYGTTVVKDGKLYVRLDGSETLTPATTTSTVKNNERAVVMIKNHSAIITGNITVPSARNDDLENAQNGVDEVKGELAEMLDKVYPVGSIYMSMSETDPKHLFGGEWERLQNRFLLGASDSYNIGSTGGEASHKLTVDELPAHNHSVNEQRLHRLDSADGNTDFIVFQGGSGSYGGWNINNDGTGNNKGSARLGILAFNTNNTGGSAAHNNMPPYLSVYMWKRIK